jgi:hypothetical protein
MRFCRCLFSYRHTVWHHVGSLLENHQLWYKLLLASFKCKWRKYWIFGRAFQLVKRLIIIWELAMEKEKGVEAWIIHHNLQLYHLLALPNVAVIAPLGVILDLVVKKYICHMKMIVVGGWPTSIPANIYSREVNIPRFQFTGTGSVDLFRNFLWCLHVWTYFFWLMTKLTDIDANFKTRWRYR